MLEQIMQSIQLAMEENSLIEFNTKDKEDILQMAFDYIDHFMKEFLLTMQKPSFHVDLFDSVLEYLIQNFENIYNEEFEEELRNIIQKACSLYFSTTLPRRSYKKTFEKPRINKEKITQIIKFLREVPQHEQRTTKWYEDRWNMISASSAWKALSSDAHKNNLIFEKCTPLNTEKYASVNVDSPFHWGQKYEPLSIIIYEDKYNTKVEDFGCIPHKDFKNIGASPDGINTDPKSSRFGRMVEVKNRFSESVPITGNPKEEYWIQMQMQMNVCELNECDFLETRFKEYQTSIEFYNDGKSFNKTENGKLKGIYIYFQKDGFPHYEYPPLNQSKEEFEIWEENMIQTKTKDGYEWIKNNYWYLDKYSCVLVFRNRAWFCEAVKKINEVWKIILYERENGFEHRAPNKRNRKISEPIKSKCLINTTLLKVI